MTQDEKIPGEITDPNEEQLDSITSAAQQLAEKFKTGFNITLINNSHFIFEVETEDEEEMQDLSNEIIHEIDHVIETPGTKLFLGNWSEHICTITHEGRSIMRQMNQMLSHRVILFYDVSYE